MADRFDLIPEVLEPGTPVFEARAVAKTGTTRTFASATAMTRWISEQLADPDVHQVTIERCPDDPKVRDWRTG
ncbi:hypothetical protein [Lentzea sp. NBRC 102530]|uniref:hypothetical protein n=1 Tax=Lentzea sp. NBRC 102530 TaxID=3032201 RepID=UPI002554E95D|nr:hypothetical protein [Lentzea sp. NBRC 102530]